MGEKEINKMSSKERKIEQKNLSCTSDVLEENQRNTQ